MSDKPLPLTSPVPEGAIVPVPASDPPLCCWCGVPVGPMDLRDAAAAADFRLTGLCQLCQDQTYFARSTADPGLRHVLRRGAVVAARWRALTPCEVAILPFVFIVPEPRIAWDPRLAVRAGPALPADDVSDAFFPMSHAWSKHRVRVSQVERLDHPAVHEALAGAELVVALDVHALCAVTHWCGPLPIATRVSLTDLVPWHDAYRLTPLQCLDMVRLLPFGDRDITLPWPPTPLGECAVLARFLELSSVQPAYASRTAFELVLGSLAGRFPESVASTASGDGT